MYKSIEIDLDEDIASAEPFKVPAMHEQTAKTRNDVTNTADESRTLAVASKQRKAPAKRSVVWEHFTQIYDVQGVRKGKCIHCAKEFYCDPKKHGTTTLKNHMNNCKMHPHSVETRQTQLSLQPTSNIDGTSSSTGTLTNWKFDQEYSRKCLALMIILDELPFSFVEGEGFRKFVASLCPWFKVPSRWTVTRDVNQLFNEEKKTLRAFIKEHAQTVCVTTDTWSSIQNINYMCVTVHFIDNDWKLQKKIVNFCPVGSHRGEMLALDLERCFKEWGIYDKVFCITVDNARTNDKMIATLKHKFVAKGMAFSEGKYLHVRCVAHIFNLIVQEGLKDVDMAIKKIRNACKFVRSSPARLKKFKECCIAEGVEWSTSLCLDVVTRWNSTFLMLNTALKYEKVFDVFESIDPYYKIELDGLMPANLNMSGVPGWVDWRMAERITNMLNQFYLATLRISGSLYITSNTYWTEISDLYAKLCDWKTSTDVELMQMGIKMQCKFDKYWGDYDKVNKIIYMASVLDPREKFEYMEDVFVTIYGDQKGKYLFEGVKIAMHELFNEYKKKLQPESTQGVESRPSSTSSRSDVGERGILKQRIKRARVESGVAGDKKTELELYLNEAVYEDEKGDFDLLKWWKLNSERFPILSHMARDILAVPISTVASESAFSAGGRVLDPFRSSLTPKIVETLICTQDWLRGCNEHIKIEEDLDVIEKLEDELEKFNQSGAQANQDTSSSVNLEKSSNLDSITLDE